jgi:hypothetical protein
MAITLREKDPDDVRPYFVIWCSKDGTNANTAADTGDLKGATIASSTWTVPDGIIKDSDNTAAVTIAGVSYAINTVATIWVSSGTDNTPYDLTNKITTDESPVRTLSQTIRVPVREQ